MGTELRGILNISEELIKKSFSLSRQVQSFPDEAFGVEEIPGSSHVIFSFPGSWSVDSWYAGEKAFGETEIGLVLFPSMKSIGNYDGAAKPEEREFATAFVNKAFLQKFEHVLLSSLLDNQVNRAVSEGKSIIFTGHSTGGATAALATIWFLEKCRTAEMRANSGKFFCVTFGSPLVGNHIISHALRRENWSQYFIHFVMRYDLVPRILLAPLSSIKQEFEKIHHFFDPNSPNYRSESLALDLYTNVMRNASSVTSHVASKLKGSTNLLLETVTNFIKLSPYRPFGTYVFCTGNGKLVVLKNPEAVLQLLFYSCQLSSETERTTIAVKCLNDHLAYEDSLNMQNVIPGDDKLEELALGPDSYFDDLGLSVRARLCLRAAGQVEKKKKENQNKIIAKKDKIKDEMKKLQDYQAQCEHNGGYYVAFKLQNDPKDFQANVTRLELAGIWDEIMEMLKKYELPDEFEATEDWITLGTQFRNLVEPLDIANYYRHSKDEDSGPYMNKGRPKRYKYTQRWLEHQRNLPAGYCGESYSKAEEEELHRYK